jgi:hypothetical protein
MNVFLPPVNPNAFVEAAPLVELTGITKPL